MFKVSADEVSKFFTNRYEAVVVLAKEARRANQYLDEEAKEKSEKPVMRAIKKLMKEGIKFAYETPQDEVSSE